MTKQQIAEQMKAMAEFDPRFRVVYDFFQELQLVNKKGYVHVCRVRMPVVANALIKSHPGLENSPMMISMQCVHTLSDEQVIHLSAMLLKTIVDSVEQQSTKGA